MTLQATPPKAGQYFFSGFPFPQDHPFSQEVLSRLFCPSLFCRRLLGPCPTPGPMWHAVAVGGRPCAPCFFCVIVGRRDEVTATWAGDWVQGEREGSPGRPSSSQPGPYIPCLALWWPDLLFLSLVLQSTCPTRARVTCKMAFVSHPLWSSLWADVLLRKQGCFEASHPSLLSEEKSKCKILWPRDHAWIGKFCQIATQIFF